MKYIYALFCYTILTSALIAQKNSTKDFAPLFTVTKSDLSTDNTEFGALLASDNTVYFTQANSNLENDDKNKSHLDIYSATFNKDQSFSEVKALTSINSKWHDGTATISSDGNTMYFASESFNTKKGFEKEKTPSRILKKGKIYLFKATKVNGEWTNITALPFNKSIYSVRNPSISEDGKTLYFSSNMPGGFGGEDIWKVSVNGDSFGDPENLGNKINSEANESFPFISNNQVLYFSSNKKSGYGGLDVYRVELMKNEGAVNLGAPINSKKDDFSFSLNATKNIGFLSSNRDQSDDIYMITPICQLIAKIKVVDKVTQQDIPNAALEIHNEKGIGQSIATSNNPYVAKLECKKSFNLKASKDGYEDANLVIEPSADGGEVYVTLEMVSVPIITEKEVILQDIYFEFDKSNVTQQGKVELNKLVTVLKANPDMKIEIKSHTDNQGSKEYNLNLSNKRAKATVDYIISMGISKNKISGKGFGESQLKIDCKPCTEQENNQNRRSEFMIVKD